MKNKRERSGEESKEIKSETKVKRINYEERLWKECVASLRYVYFYIIILFIIEVRLFLYYYFIYYLLVGGMFLIWKATREIHEKVEDEEDHDTRPTKVSFASVIFQIMLLDIVFSLDSVITAVGMADDIGVMISAVVISVGIMMFAAKSVGDFVQRHPTVKMLALAFLILIGTNLMAEGWHFHIPKGYVYFAMAFSVFVEMLNLRVSKKKGRVH